MNANSKNKRLAWAFLKFLISEEVQYEFGWQIGGGMSINNAARDRRVKADIVSREYSESEMFMQQAPADGTEIILNDEQQRIYEDYTAHVERYADMLNTYRINDATVADIVTTETESFFKGEKTAEEAANVIQNKISLYLNE
jgi:ABC-type glycerol-3-phosphate transport system substrate-binding protein